MLHSNVQHRKMFASSFLWIVADLPSQFSDGNVNPWTHEAERGNWDIYDDFKLKNTLGISVLI